MKKLAAFLAEAQIEVKFAEIHVEFVVLPFVNFEVNDLLVLRAFELNRALLLLDSVVVRLELGGVGGR